MLRSRHGDSSHVPLTLSYANHADLVWTIVLVITFIHGVLHTFAMPDFDAMTLGLMGISSGTYVGFKFGEKVS